MRLILWIVYLHFHHCVFLSHITFLYVTHHIIVFVRFCLCLHMFFGVFVDVLLWCQKNLVTTVKTIIKKAPKICFASNNSLLRACFPKWFVKYSHFHLWVFIFAFLWISFVYFSSCVSFLAASAISFLEGMKKGRKGGRERERGRKRKIFC